MKLYLGSTVVFEQRYLYSHKGTQCYVTYVYVIIGKEKFCHPHVGFSAPHKQVITSLVVSFTWNSKVVSHTVIEVCLISSFFPFFFLSFFIPSFRSFVSCLLACTYVCMSIFMYVYNVCMYECICLSKGRCWTSL